MHPQVGLGFADETERTDLDRAGRKPLHVRAWRSVRPERRDGSDLDGDNSSNLGFGGCHGFALGNAAVVSADASIAATLERRQRRHNVLGLELIAIVDVDEGEHDRAARTCPQRPVST